MADDQKRLQSLSDDLQKFQDGTLSPSSCPPPNTHLSDLQTTIDARQRLESQQQENRSVKKEFEALSDDSKVFKMVGPVLLKQDRSEALGAVNGRLEFIAKSIKDTEDRIKELQGTSEMKRSELMQLQQKMQSAAQGQVAG